MILAPIVKKPSEYTDEERAIAAGVMLWWRKGILKALASATREMEIATEDGRENLRKYYQTLERGNRFVLYWLGYETFRNRMYAPEETVPR